MACSPDMLLALIRMGQEREGGKMAWKREVRQEENESENRNARSGKTRNEGEGRRGRGGKMRKEREDETGRRG